MQWTEHEKKKLTVSASSTWQLNGFTMWLTLIQTSEQWLTSLVWVQMETTAHQGSLLAAHISNVKYLMFNF